MSDEESWESPWDELKVLRAAYGSDAAARAALKQCRKIAWETSGGYRDKYEVNLRSNVSAAVEYAVKHWTVAQSARPAAASKMAKQAIVNAARSPDSALLNPQVSRKRQGKTEWGRAFEGVTLANPVAEPDEKVSELERVSGPSETGNPGDGDYDVIPSRPIPVKEYVTRELKFLGVAVDGTESVDELLEAYGNAMHRYQPADPTPAELQQMEDTRISYRTREAMRIIDAFEETDLDGYWCWRLVRQYEMSETLAAEKLGISQPTVSRAVKRIDEALAESRNQTQ